MTIARIGQRMQRLASAASFSRVPTVSLQTGASDRAASATARRDALAKFDWVMWNVYRSSSLAATLESTIAYIKATNPDSINSNYVIAYELGGQLGTVSALTRSGSTVTLDTPKIQAGMGVGNTFTIWGSAGFSGTWTVASVSGTFNNPGSLTFTVSGGAAAAPSEATEVAACYQAVNTANYVHVAKMFAENWWLRKQGLAGPLTAWATSFGAFDANLYQTPVDVNGDDWVSYLAKDVANVIFGACNGIDYEFLDNYNDPRDDKINDATYPGQRGLRDWLRNGTLQSRTDPTILAGHRAGYARFAQISRSLSAGRAKSPNIKCVGNVDATFSGTGWENTIEAGFLEGFTGSSFALPTIEARMAHHDMVRSRLLAPAQVVMATRGTSVTDWKGFRFGLGHVLMRPGTFFSFSGASYDNTTWYDEFDIVLGDVVDPEPDAAWQTGVWRNRFRNGWALLNPTASAVTLDLSAYSLRSIGAADIGRTPQDAATNSGAAVTSLTLAASDGIVLLYA